MQFREKGNQSWSLGFIGGVRRRESEKVVVFNVKMFREVLLILVWEAIEVVNLVSIIL